MFAHTSKHGSLYHGDCLQIMKEIPNKCVDMILCDLPYGTTACTWDSIIPFEPLWNQYERIIKDNGAIVLTSSQPFTTKLINSNIKNFKHYWIWDKEICGAFALAKKRPMIVTEEICVFAYNGKVNYYPIMEEALKKNIRPINKGTNVSEAVPVSSGIAKSDKNYNPNKRFPKNIIKYSKYNGECNQLRRLHPTQKPVALFEYLIKTYTIEGELVLDNCIGSGTTAIACINTNRKYIGIEKDDKYIEVAKKRIVDHEVKHEIIG